MTYAVDDLFDLSQTTHGALFDGVQYPWDALKRLAGYLTQNLKPGSTGAEVHPAAHVGPEVFIGAGTIVEPGAMILHYRTRFHRLSQRVLAGHFAAQHDCQACGLTHRGRATPTLSLRMAQGRLDPHQGALSRRNTHHQ
jgi:hypothetical protein